MVVVPRPIWLLGSAICCERTYNVDLLVGFVLGLLLTIILTTVLNSGIAQIMQS